MPALHLFRRRTIFAGDDLQLTSFLTVLARAVQLFLFLIPILGHMIREADYFIHKLNQDKEGGGEDQEEEGGSFWAYIFGGESVYADECQRGDWENDYNNDEGDGNKDGEQGGGMAHYFPLFLFLYLITSMIHFLLSSFVEYTIYKTSSIGSPTEPERRNSKLVHVLEKKWIWISLVGNLGVLSLVLVSILYKNPYFSCRDHMGDMMDGEEEEEEGQDDENYTLNPFAPNRLWWIALLLLSISQIGEFLVSAVALGNLLRQRVSHFVAEGQDRLVNGHNDDDNHHYYNHHHHHHYHPDHPHELMEEMWDTRCRNFCKCAAFSTCFLFGGRELMDDMVGDYGHISRALADYFEDGGALDLVPSDIAAGFMMLQRVQRLRVLEAQKNIVEEMKSEVTPSTQKSESQPKQQQDDTSMGFHVTDNNTNPALYWNRDDGIKRTMSEEKETYKNLQNSSADNGIVHKSLMTGRFEESPPPLLDMGTSPLQLSPHYNFLILPNNNNDDSDNLDNSSENTLHDTAVTLKMKSDQSRDASHWYEAQRRKVLSSEDELDRMTLSEGARFARHALSIYSWLLYVYMYPGTGLTKLVYNRLAEVCKKKTDRRMYDCGTSVTSSSTVNDERSSLLCGDMSENIIGDNALHINRNALLAHAGLEDSDLIFADFNNTYHKMPYCIVVDHKWKSVVLSIRGTLSLEDCVIDVLVDPEPLTELGNEFNFNADGEYCHSGVLGCAKIIYKELQRHRILDQLLVGPDAMFPHYSLRIAGHSLGAGTATLLGYMMRQKFPNLRVISISPPGGFITWRLATECKDFVTSFVLDSDLVPRLSVAAMEQLRDEVLELFGRIKVPKIDIAQSFLRNGVFCDKVEEDNLDFLAHNNEKMLHSVESMPTDSTFSRQMERFKEIQQNRKRERGERREIKLFPPGQMVHLMKTGERNSCLHALANCATCCTTNAGYEYTPVWVDNGDFNEIVVSPTMGTDHFPNRVCLELERVAESLGVDTTIGSSLKDREEAEKARRMGSSNIGVF